MSERPILFRGEMVRAILEGRKTQTRRPIKPQPVVTGFAPDLVNEAWQAGFIKVSCSYGKPGDRLWVRETWQIEGNGVIYRATCEHVPAHKWKPSIFLKREHSRITLEIIDIRVERLQDISEEDAKAEGVKPFPNDPEGDCWTDGKHRTAVNYLWNEIHGWDSWMANPWLWVIEFRVLPQTAQAVPSQHAGGNAAASGDPRED